MCMRNLPNNASCCKRIISPRRSSFCRLLVCLKAFFSSYNLLILVNYIRFGYSSVPSKSISLLEMVYIVINGARESGGQLNYGILH